jgi:glycosyltransferase involved in cell wall biosynthesis
MNILILSPFLPFPEDNGSKIRVMNFIKALQGHNIYLVSFYERENEIVGRELKEICSEVYTFKKPEISKLAVFLNHFSLRPLLSYRFYTKDADEFIKSIVEKHKINVILTEALLMAEYARNIKGIYRILDAHNIEFVRAFRRIEKTKNILKKVYYFLIYFRLKNYELRVIQEFEGCFVCSQIDKNVIKKYLPYKEPIVIPNAVDVQYFKPQNKESISKKIVFLGTLWYEPNLDAVKFFIDEIFPLVKEKFKDIEFWVLGEGVPSDFKRHSEKKDIVFTGYVDDVRTYLNESLIFVAPLRMGSGTRFKILTAMAMGLPVVSTTVGCEGLEVRDRENICIADNPVDFANAIIKLIEDNDFRENIIKNGKEFVEKRYSREIVMDQIKRIFNDPSFKI